MKILTLLSALLLTCPALAQNQAPEAAAGRQQKSEASARNHMVAAAHPLAAAAGREMLRKGGTAMDAAVAVQMMLTLVEPQSSGIGGGAFILYWDARQRQLHAFDGRETAPAGATPQRFLKADGRPMSFREAVPSGLSVGIPGAVAALELGHRALGRLPWAAAFAPAIAAAEQGFTVTPRLSRLLELEQALRRDPAARDLYYSGANSPLPAGTTLRNPALAESLKLVASKGADALRTGPLADAIVAAVRQGGGDMTPADLAAYEAKRRPELCGNFRLFRICGMGPPSSGGIAVLQILGIMQALQPQAATGLDTTDLHYFAEAGRLAFADRNLYVADPDFTPVPVAGLVDRNYLAERARLVSATASMGQAVAGNPPGRRGEAPGLWLQEGPPGTSHISIIDAEGNGLSMTTTIEDAFGSRIMVGGFLLNNQLTDFAFQPENEGRPVANRVEAGKRPRSSMAPSLVFDPQGRLMLAAGSPGGSQIINYVARSLYLILDKGFGVQAAVDLPHFGSRNGPTEVETGSDPAWAVSLERLGHKVQALEMTSGLHIVSFGPQGFRGGADPRREGVALGD